MHLQLYWNILTVESPAGAVGMRYPKMQTCDRDARCSGLSPAQFGVDAGDVASAGSWSVGQVGLSQLGGWAVG